MKTLNNLVKELQNNDQIIRFRQLEDVIFNNSNLLEQYQLMNKKQKKMVNDKEFGRKNYEISKKDYETHKEELMTNIVVGEYLTLLSDINNDLQFIENIISYQINKEFED